VTTALASRSLASRAGSLPWPLILLGLLIVIVAAGTIVFPTYTAYDATYSLLWGREILDGQLPVFATYRAPTEHPLGLVFGVFFAAFGRAGDRLMLLATMGSFVLMVVALYQLARNSFTVLVGLAAAAILCTRFDFPVLAARAFIDIPYLALLLWAAALEVARPRRGALIFWLLALAGLLRPEAWIIAGIYWLWLFPGLSWRRRVEFALLVGAAPLIWFGVDYIVTGDPLFSQTHTTAVTAEDGRSKPAGEIPGETVLFFSQLLKLPVMVAGLIGLGLAAWLVPQRIRVVLSLFLIGLFTFVLLALGQFSVISRYLLLPAIMLMIFAAFLVAGFTVIKTGNVRKYWSIAAAVSVAALVIWTVARVNVGVLVSELKFRGDSMRALTSLLDRPDVRAAAKCGPVLTSNHRLVPGVRWIMDLPADQVIARSDVPESSKVKSGIVVLAAGRAVLLRGGLDHENPVAADTLRNLPPAGYRPIAANELYSVYGRCR
jgi:hypothetical protein